ncbi:hypothetical protein TPAR_07085 [Tolypocladium paradoxum]|uniref:Uncharacterized protein n=1 Tax=Tolypocladium paradoxum TaxID=94208 RepID=A0A2S4KR99_9HYPO|nr:hypothetical protein TPAR_07085 [Tolypocladium paradoxum]
MCPASSLRCPRSRSPSTAKRSSCPSRASSRARRSSRAARCSTPRASTSFTGSRGSRSWRSRTRSCRRVEAGASGILDCLLQACKYNSREPTVS